METINGYTIIAQRPIRGGNLRTGERVILGVRDLSPAYTGYEYVTAIARAREESPTSWMWGHYTRDLIRAVADFQEG